MPDEEAEEEENGEERETSVERMEVGNGNRRTEERSVSDGGEGGVDREEDDGASEDVSNMSRESDDEDDEELKQRLSASGVILPLGWPKVCMYAHVILCVLRYFFVCMVWNSCRYIFTTNYIQVYLQVFYFKVGGDINLCVKVVYLSLTCQRVIKVHALSVIVLYQRACSKE